jgi:uncharacterized C2H2 Zn-finger protein
MFLGASIKRARLECETCKTTFSRSDALKRHQLIHNRGEKAFECGHCGKKFQRASDLKRHEQIHEKRTAEREFKCTKCGETFRNAAPFRPHIKSAHPTNTTGQEHEA